MAIENYIIFNVNLNGGSEWSKRDTILQAIGEEHPRKETMNGTRDISTLIGRVLATEKEREKRRVGKLNFAAWFCRSQARCGSSSSSSSKSSDLTILLFFSSTLP